MPSSRISILRASSGLETAPKAFVFAGMALTCALAILCAGCLGLGHKTRAASPVTSAPAPRPIEEAKTPPPATPPPAVKEPAAQVPLPAGEETMKNPTKPPAPVRKQTAENTEPAPVKPAPPQISPQLSPDAQAQLEQKTNDNIATAQKNLEQASGRSLNSSQKDMVEKIQGFLSESREAMMASDWGRAENLSQKAYLLSVELINSL
jgi:outer membrane biosynthesis protein TonB